MTTQTDTDEALVEQARRGSSSAFAELVARYQNRAYATAIGVLSDFDAAQDVAQEAFIKAIGRGLSFPLDRFDVSLDPREPARLLALRGEEYREQEWTLQAPSIASGYRAALVTPSPASARIHPMNTQPISG